ncbi:four-carbon acid sugar kinase family protein [Bacillus sp. JJ1533]|uniref:four-carbon acid sugar kinase family protein n=1 Tax=Bacillus sp. JJ1533 TaxID=3122959 RepID=UPI002FFD632D
MIGVVGDDITGSNDIGIMFGNSNYTVNVYSYENGMNLPEQNADVVVLDTDSRFDAESDAYKKVFGATKTLQKLGVQQFFNKTCSVFRGNIGAEFDAMLDALDEDFAVIVLGFPKNGRKTINGNHYVHDRLLEESEFRNDPVHPMKHSNLVDILQAQTKRKVSNVNLDIVRKGPEVLRKELFERKKDNNYVIVDVEGQQDLQTIAQAVHDFKVLAGSSALAEELPKVKGQKEEKEIPKTWPTFIPNKGLFCAAGSLMPQTADQVLFMKEKGAIVLELSSLELLKNGKDVVKQKLCKQAIESINSGEDVILHSSHNAAVVKETKERALEQGMSNLEISRLVSQTIAEITDTVIRETGQKRFVIAGGDTSAAVCRVLGINGMRVWKEIQPGIPSCLSLTKDPILFVLKSGSFGKADFFEKAFTHLRNQLVRLGEVQPR